MTAAVPPFLTHEVTNQPPPLEGVNWFEQDRALLEAVEREGGAWGKERLSRFGAWLGQPSTIRLGEQANRHPPQLRSHDRFGHRIDEVEFHPAWHELLGRAVAEQVHALPWSDGRPGAHVVRAASAFLLNQVESGVCCPLAMTFAAPAALGDAPALAERLAAQDSLDHLRSAAGACRRQGRRAGRHGDDREAGRLRRARQYHRGAPARQRHVRADRPQMVLLGADVGRLPDPGPGAGRPELLPGAALAPRRHAQRHADPAPQGQARQPLQRLGRDRVRGRARLAGRRGGSWRAHHHQDGPPHPARRRDQFCRADASGACPGAAPRGPSHRIPAPADRPAADAQRARRPRPRGRRRRPRL